MQLSISLAKGEPGELESLCEWLSQERGLTGHVAFRAGSPGPGQLGLLRDTLIVAASSGGTLSVLAASLKAWVSLPRRSDVRLKVQGPDGSMVEIDAKRVREDRLDALIGGVVNSRPPAE